MTLWRWAALLSLPFLLIALSFGRIDGIKACPGEGEPILNFELVASPAEVAAQFPPDCAQAAIAAQGKALRLDNLGFIPVYSALFIVVLMALGSENPGARRLVQLGVTMVVVAAAADYWENSRLAAIAANLPGDQATIDQLYPAPRIKFGLLALVEILIGLLHWQAGGWRRLAGGAMAIGGALTLAGFAANREWILLGGMIAFLPTLIANFALAARRGAARG